VYPLPINGLDSFLRTHQTLSGPRIWPPPMSFEISKQPSTPRCPKPDKYSLHSPSQSALNRCYVYAGFPSYVFLARFSTRICMSHLFRTVHATCPTLPIASTEVYSLTKHTVTNWATFCIFIAFSPDSPTVGLKTKSSLDFQNARQFRLRAGRVGVRIPAQAKDFSPKLQTNSGAHPAQNSMPTKFLDRR
jgi:hypothetical protein